MSAGHPSPRLEAPAARRRVVLAPGGSAGHVTVALALAEAFAAAEPPIEVRILCSGGAFELRLIAAAGIDCAVVPALPFRRQGLAGKLLALAAVPKARRAARAVLDGWRPHLVVGTGAYGSIPVVLAARALGAGVVLHEANAEAGLANRLLARIADRVVVGDLWNGSATFGARARVLGTPVRRAVRLAGAGSARAIPWRLLVTAGAEGSPFLDRAAPPLLRELSRRLAGRELEVRHQTARGDAEAVAAEYAACGVRAEVAPYFEPLAESYRWCDAVVTAGGAATLAELASTGLPALVVPVASVAGDHQRRNAEQFRARSGAEWLAESAWTLTAAADALAAILADEASWRRASERMRGSATEHAAERIVAECVGLIAELADRSARHR